MSPDDFTAIALTAKLAALSTLPWVANDYIVGVGLTLLMWVALTLIDPSGQAGSTPLGIRMTQYGAGVLVVW